MPTIKEQLKTIHQPTNVPQGQGLVGPAEIAALARGIATAGYKHDKRLLDPTSPINIGNQQLLGIPTQNALAPFPDDPLGPGQILTTLFEARARNEASPELFTVFVSKPVDFLSNTVPGSPTFTETDIRIRVEWGAGGARHSADIDGSNGAVITVSGIFVRVSAILSLVTVLPFPLFGSISVSASASYEPRPAPFPNTWSVLLNAGAPIAPAAALSVRVPPWAHRVTVYSGEAGVAPNVSQPVSISLFPPASAIPTTIVQPPNAIQSILIPQPRQSITVINTSAVAVFITVVFELVL